MENSIWFTFISCIAWKRFFLKSFSLPTNQGTFELEETDFILPAYPLRQISCSGQGVCPLQTTKQGVRSKCFEWQTARPHLNTLLMTRHHPNRTCIMQLHTPKFSLVSNVRNHGRMKTCWCAVWELQRGVVWVVKCPHLCKHYHNTVSTQNARSLCLHSTASTRKQFPAFFIWCLNV